MRCRSWKARTEQCLPKAARDLYLRMRRAADSSVVAKTREDLGISRSSSSVLSQQGLATNEFCRLAYWGLQERSSLCTASGELKIFVLLIEMELVLTASI